jgi:DNA-binding XRE family transcriptional regulator
MTRTRATTYAPAASRTAADPTTETTHGKENVNAVVGASVRAERARLRVTQTELAQRLGWSRDRVPRLEKGQCDVRLTELLLLCRVLGASMNDLMIGADEDDIAVLGL